MVRERSPNADANDHLSAAKDFASLSLLDLLVARDLFHVHLMNKRNVVATAVGRYLVRKSDPVPTEHHRGSSRRPKAARPPRRLEDSEVRFYSWPCLLVFVAKWIPEGQFGRDGIASQDYVPPTIYLPDGREVPVCVVEAPLVERIPAAPSDMAFPENIMGGGYPVIARVQGEEHLASIGCMVTDGHKAYAITNRHVAGDPGERVYALVDGKQVPIGTASARQLTRRAFTDVYPGWPGKDVYVNMDVGLVEVDDKTRWTAQIYGIGETAEMVDVSVHNLALNIIGAPVRAYGCASRQMAGQILALFYRYKSAGGFDYVADFLIGPRRGSTKPFRTGPGDSGTVWLYEERARTHVSAHEPPAGDTEAGKIDLRPIAIQWGGHVFAGQGGPRGGQYPYALATSLATACSHLDVSVVRDWNVGLPDYWGAVGHYSIALKAIEALPAGKLRKLMQANLQNVTYTPDHIRANEMKGLSKRPFVPLADVPDYVWKMGPHRSREQPNHFADMDRKDSSGRTLLQIARGPNGLAVETWQRYYADVKDGSRGLLPFRVWQCYDAMVRSAQAGDAARFLCAAGVVSHYLGDACQPLHISHLFNGDPDRKGEDGKAFGNGVHAAYEDVMVNAHTPELIHRVDGASGTVAEFEPVHDGVGAAALTVDLMQRTFDRIAPADIIDVFAGVSGGSSQEIADALWGHFDDATVEVMSSGAAALAHLWLAAWKSARGDDRISVAAEPLSNDDLVAIYRDEYLADRFLPSRRLADIAQELEGGAAEEAPSGRITSGARRVAHAARSIRPRRAARRRG